MTCTGTSKEQKMKTSVNVAVWVLILTSASLAETPVATTKPTEADQKAIDEFIKIITAKMPADWAANRVEKGKVSIWYWSPSEGQGVMIQMLPKRLLKIKDGKPTGLFVWLMEPGFSGVVPPEDNRGRQTVPPRQIATWRGWRVFMWAGEDWKTCEADVMASLKDTGKVSAATTTLVAPEALSSRIVIPTGSKLVKGFFDGSLELTNNSDATIRVCTRCVQGRGVSKDGQFSHVALIAQRWRTDPPSPEETANSSVEVAPGKTVTLPFRAVCKKSGKLLLSVTYDVPEENVPAKHGIWTGRVEAKPVDLEVTAEGVTVLTQSSQPASQKALGTRQ
jgi:hypothetical protein